MSQKQPGLGGGCESEGQWWEMRSERQVGTLHAEPWANKTIHVLYEGRSKEGRGPAPLNPHFRCFTVLPGASAEERQDGSRETHSEIITSAGDRSFEYTGDWKRRASRSALPLWLGLAYGFNWKEESK